MTTSTSGATGLGRRFFQETPYGMSVDGHLERTARHNTSFDNQGWLNAKTNVGLPCPGKARPTWPPHWIYPTPRSNETELVRYAGTECRTSPFVPQISPDFVPPNERFRVSSDADPVDSFISPNSVASPSSSTSPLQPPQSSQSSQSTSLTSNQPSYNDWPTFESDETDQMNQSEQTIEKKDTDKLNLTMILTIGFILLLLVVGAMVGARRSKQLI